MANELNAQFGIETYKKADGLQITPQPGTPAFEKMAAEKLEAADTARNVKADETPTLVEEKKPVKRGRKPKTKEVPVEDIAEKTVRVNIILTKSMKMKLDAAVLESKNRDSYVSATELVRRCIEKSLDDVIKEL